MSDVATAVEAAAILVSGSHDAEENDPYLYAIDVLRLHPDLLAAIGTGDTPEFHAFANMLYAEREGAAEVALQAEKESATADDKDGDARLCVQCQSEKERTAIEELEDVIAEMNNEIPASTVHERIELLRRLHKVRSALIVLIKRL